MCGIVGIYKTRDDVCSEIYDGLIQVQHRGQDAAGISTWDGSKMHLQKALGLVTEAFKQDSSYSHLVGNIGMGMFDIPQLDQMRLVRLSLSIQQIQ